jgi:hypothetical protein
MPEFRSPYSYRQFEATVKNKTRYFHGEEVRTFLETVMETSGSLAILADDGPIRYGTQRNAKTRSADPALIVKARRYGLRELMREARTSQHSTERFLRGDRVHPATRARLTAAIATLDRASQSASN